MSLNVLAKEINKINSDNGWEILSFDDWIVPSKEDIEDYLDIDVPHYMKADEDCMGNLQGGYWRVFGKVTNGRTYIGNGKSKEEAIDNLKETVIKESIAIYKIPAKLALLTSEVSEALEAFRNRDFDNFKEELADVLIRLLDMSGGLNIDLDESVREKLEKNKKRGYKHGGKII